MYCRKYLTDNYKKVYEIRRQQNPDCRMYMDANELINQKNYITKDKTITQTENEEIKKNCKEIKEVMLTKMRENS
jgi:hypothetical protein